ncbi:MAG: sigma-70 family RNA polymerase sigma factor [Flavobacteriales bacterium]|nr:sigma-70 family RNA polymerase sigma factor [Flavobacteriales bacterium]
MSQTSRYHQTKDEVLNEAEIIESSKKDPKCFKPIYDKYFGQIMQFIYNRIDDKELAADLTQQVFLKALKGLNKYEFIGLPFSSFLYRIASNELNEAFRKNSKLMTINLSDSIVTTLHEELPDEDLKEKIQKLKEVLKQLAEAEFRLLELRFFEDRPFKEIGEILEITENNAKVKTYRALEKLKLLITPKL